VTVGVGVGVRVGVGLLDTGGVDREALDVGDDALVLASAGGAVGATEPVDAVAPLEQPVSRTAHARPAATPMRLVRLLRTCLTPPL
jgi:hypothetical protein